MNNFAYGEHDNDVRTLWLLTKQMHARPKCEQDVDLRAKERDIGIRLAGLSFHLSLYVCTINIKRNWNKESFK